MEWPPKGNEWKSYVLQETILHCQGGRLDVLVFHISNFYGSRVMGIRILCTLSGCTGVTLSIKNYYPWKTSSVRFTSLKRDSFN